MKSKRFTSYPSIRVALLAAGVALAPNALAAGVEQFRVGNAVFIHPDGAALNSWNAARMFWEGADGTLEWDKLPQLVVYRGHQADQQVGTSNGGATSHAFGVKVQGPDSYGRDRGREILALSGYPGSFLREAAERGHPVGIVNDGDIAGEPGTGAFLAESDNRGQAEAHSLQLIAGRPGFNGARSCTEAQVMDGVTFDADDPNADCDVTDGEPDPQVVLGGGERFFLPTGIPQLGTPECEALIGAARNSSGPTLDDPKLECFIHRGPEDGRTPTRDDGRNLLQEAVADGWTVVRTRAEFDELFDRVENARRFGPSRQFFAPKVLGVFSDDDLFNDEGEAELIAAGLVRGDGDPLPSEVAGLSAEEAKRKIGSQVLWGSKFGDPENPYSFNPPTPAEMMALALFILERKSDMVGKPFGLVAEVESTDNMPNANNATGTLRALKRADDLIGVTRDFQNRRNLFRREGDPRTLIITAADSDGSGLQLFTLRKGTVDSPFNPLFCGDPNGDSNNGDTVSDNKSICEWPDSSETVTRTTVNPNFSSSEINVNLDGIDGWNSPAFLSAPDELSDERAAGDPRFGNFDTSGLGSFGGDTEAVELLRFGIGWAGLPDTAGGIITRAEGLNSQLLGSPFPFTLDADEKPFYQRFDNTDIYRLVYLTLFGERLPTGVGRLGEDR